MINLEELLDPWEGAEELRGGHDKNAIAILLEVLQLVYQAPAEPLVTLSPWQGDHATSS